MDGILRVITQEYDTDVASDENKSDLANSLINTTSYVVQTLLGFDESLLRPSLAFGKMSLIQTTWVVCLCVQRLRQDGGFGSVTWTGHSFGGGSVSKLAPTHATGASDGDVRPVQKYGSSQQSFVCSRCVEQ